MRIFFGALLLSTICVSGARAAGISCSKPVAIPDAWSDTNGNGVYEPGIDVYDPNLTGYTSANSGELLNLKPASPVFSVTSEGYVPVDFPPLNRGNPISGEDIYRQWLAKCSPFLLFSADTLLVDAGINSGVTLQGFVDLISQDPTAYWDGTTVVSQQAPSPRVVTLLVYDPNHRAESGGTTVVLAKFLTVFVESLGPGSQMNVRIMNVATEVPVPIDPTTWGGLKRKY